MFEIKTSQEVLKKNQFIISNSQAHLISIEADYQTIQKQFSFEAIEQKEKEVPINLRKAAKDWHSILFILENYFVPSKEIFEELEAKYNDLQDLTKEMTNCIVHYKSMVITNDRKAKFWEALRFTSINLMRNVKYKLRVLKIFQDYFRIKNEFYEIAQFIDNQHKIKPIKNFAQKIGYKKQSKNTQKTAFYLKRKQYQIRERWKEIQDFQFTIQKEKEHSQDDIKSTQSQVRYWHEKANETVQETGQKDKDIESISERFLTNLHFLHQDLAWLEKLELNYQQEQSILAEKMRKTEQKLLQVVKASSTIFNNSERDGFG